MSRGTMEEVVDLGTIGPLSFIHARYLYLLTVYTAYDQTLRITLL